MAAGTHSSHFFKIIRHSTLQDKKLGIPKVFVKKFGNELSTVATITVPNGRVWKVVLTKDGTKIWFHSGWHEFVEYHSISTGYFLLFRYEKNSNFHVFIFDMSACEILYPHYCVGLKNDSLTLKPPAFNSALEIKRKSTASLESPIFRCNYESRSKRCKMEKAVGMKKTDSIGDESEHESKRTKFDEHELLDILKEMGIYVKRNFKYIAAKEKERAIAAARLFKPKNPSFMLILQPRDVSKCTTYVPFEFGKKYLISRDANKLVKLQDHDGREWSVKFWNKRSKVGGGDFTHGWSTFAKDKNLKDGDICMFELISEKNIVLKVSETMADTPFHFFKVILPSALQDKKLYHSISAGYFLVFKYEKDLNFRVLIFDITCCEIQYPYFCLSPKNDESVHHNEMENEDSVEIIDSTTPNPPEFSSFENNSFEKCPKSSGKIYTPTPLQQIEAIDIPESSSRPCSGSIPEIKHGYETPSKRLKVEEPVEINKLDATGDESELKNAAYKVEMLSSDDEDEAKTTKIDKLELLTLFEDMKISICRNVEYLTAKQRERAVNVA
ncbi:hypothetical protein Q3G72_011029 [Acer saccharum]|nr:hypothetical protein Q3G72_011029 [Acer saccharum]